MGSVNVHEKPSRCVQAIGFHNRGSLVLVPNTMTVKAKSGLDPVLEGEVSVTMPPSGFGGLACVADTRFVLSPLFTKDLPCAAWFVRTTPESAKANMGWSTMKVSNVAVAEGPHERTKASAASTSAQLPGSGPEASAASASASEFALELPVMVNTKALTNEEELVLYRPKTDQRQKNKAVNLAKMIASTERGKPSVKRA